MNILLDCTKNMSIRTPKQFIDFVGADEMCKEKGLPIGNYTSQYFANIYMTELDKYIKNELKIKYYIRFMDDGILIVENKETAKNILEKVINFTKEKLHLEMNRKTTYMPVKNGCVYCGYRVFLKHRLIKRANITRVKKRIRGWNNKWKNGIYDFKAWNQSFNSWKGYANHANSYKLVQSLNKKMDFLYENIADFI